MVYAGNVVRFLAIMTGGPACYGIICLTICSIPYHRIWKLACTMVCCEHGPVVVHMIELQWIVLSVPCAACSTSVLCYFSLRLVLVLGCRALSLLGLDGYGV